MIRANDTLDDQTRHEVLATVVAMHQAFEEAARQVDARFPGADPESRRELIKMTGYELIEAAGIALEYEHTGDVAEGLVSNMLKTACRCG